MLIYSSFHLGECDDDDDDEFSSQTGAAATLINPES